MKYFHVSHQVLTEAAGREPREAYDLWDNQGSGLDVEDYEARPDEPACDAHGMALPCPITDECESDRDLTLDTWEDIA